MTHFNGPTESIGPRLTPQHEAIKALMSDGEWRTLEQISAAVTAEGVGCPPASASAQLRHFRKPRFGGHTVEKEYLGDGLYQYRLVLNTTTPLTCVQ